MAGVKNCAVIGPGGQGGNWADRLHKHKECKLVAVCDINEGRAKQVAARNGNCNVYTDVNQLLEKERLDFVVIATPHYLHAPFTILAAEHDVNVLCEKPMAINLQQCDEMIIAARKNAVKLGFGFQHRFELSHQYAYDAARGAKGDLGSLGRVTDFQMQAKHYRSGTYYLTSSQVDPRTGVAPGQWRGRWQTEGAGILINQAVHDLDVFQYVVGPFKALSAHAATIAKEHALIEVEDTVAVSFTTQGGAVGTMMFSSSNKNTPANFYRVSGETGYVEVRNNMVTADTRYKNEEDWEVPFQHPPRHNLLENFIDAIDKDVDPLIPPEEARKSIELIRAILKSVQEERTIYFPVKDTIAYPTLHNLSRDNPLKPEDMGF
ncbi:MAG: Gfo/Idh/MocA family oxidoreductase [Candidatus Lokiarchaeota archaeon]|nr:Gfo/Idh/MocA family oxidoreductase [Candidatus Lokiarchaeota archaeon]